MTVTQFSVGFALLATTACTQIPADAPVYAPPLTTTGATSVSYDPPAPSAVLPAAPIYTARYEAPVIQSQAPAGPLYLPPAEAPVVEAPAPQVAAIQTVAPQAPIVRVLASPAPVLAAVPAPIPAPVVQAPPAPRYQAIPTIPAQAPQYTPVPEAAPAPPPAPLPVTTAEARDLTLRERIAVFGEAETVRPQSTGRQFRAIEVAKLTPRRESPFDAPEPSTPGLQVTTAEPFSISTNPSGQPYYLNSTPPAIEYHIPHIPQEEPLWCWAAAAQQAIGWVNNGRAPAQCAIVALAHGLNVQECCADREGICARTGEIPAIEKLVERFGGMGQELATVPRDPQTVYNILRRGDTLLIRLRPAPHDEAVGIRHMIMVRGIEWLRLPNNQLQATLLYNDPLGAGERAVNFDEIEGFFEQALVISKT